MRAFGLAALNTIPIKKDGLIALKAFLVKAEIR
jgi:hypothetical protein